MKTTFKNGLSNEAIKTLSDISKLYISKKTLFRERKVLVLLSHLKDEKNIRLSRELQSLILNGSEKVSELACEMLSDLMSGITIDEISFLDSISRAYSHQYYLDFMNKEVDIVKIETRISKLSNPLHLLCLLTMHNNGYLRGLAIRLLKVTNMDVGLPYVMLRTNDWVEQVSTISEKVVVKYILDSRNISHVIDNIELVDSMKKWTRGDLNKVIVAAETKLIERESYTAILSKYSSTKNNKIKRLLFDYIVINESEFENNLLLGIQSKDPVIHRKVVALINMYEDEIDLEVIYINMKKSKSTISRIASIDLASKIYNDDKFKYEIMNIIYDKSKSVREYSRFKLKQIGVINFADLYKIKLTENKSNILGSISGLGETGTSIDYIEILEFVNSEKSNIRKSAYKALYVLDESRSYEVLLDSLCMDNPIDSRYSTKLLKRTSYLNSKDLYELYNLEGFNNYVYENIIDLSNYVTKWNGLELLLEFLEVDKKEHFNLIISGLDKWVVMSNRSFMNLSEDLKSIMLKLLSDQECKLETNLINRIRFCI